MFILRDQSQLKALHIALAEFDRFMVLGEGSNVVFTEDYPGLIIKNEIRYIQVQDKKEEVWVEAGGGTNWDDLVKYCVQKGYQGIENLSLIPGTVGAAPVQNIGAYGVELADVLIKLEAYDLIENKKVVFRHDECDFGYRDSYFKNSGKGRYIILSIMLRLGKNPQPNLSYPSLQAYLKEKRLINPSLQNIRDAVIAIRRSKLPDPMVTPNAGSFFKNPVISREQFEKLSEKYPEAPNYPAGNTVKIPAGWLIEKAGWKGWKGSHVGVHNKQALVLVHDGKGNPDELLSVKNKIIDDISEKFGLLLEPEVNII